MGVRWRCMSFLSLEDKLDKLAKWYELFAAKNPIVSYLVQTHTKTLRSIRSVLNTLTLLFKFYLSISSTKPSVQGASKGPNIPKPLGKFASPDIIFHSVGLG